MLHITATFTDFYQLTMAQSYFLGHQKQHQAVFDYYFRTLPFKGGYCIFAGLEDFLSALEHIQFTDADIEFLQKQQIFHPDFLNYLKTFKFNGDIYATQEGDVVFPFRPIVTVKGNIIETQIIETLLLNILNFQSLIATKACRMRYIAKDKQLIEFGLRRSQGLGGNFASRAAIIGGFDATSNVKAAKDYELNVAGTMAHSFIQSHDDELTAFRNFTNIWPDNSILLVDTYNTLESGVPNAITIAKELEQKGHKLQGIRLDSGDLAYLTKKARNLLDNAGLKYVKITISNQLDENVIKSLIEQNSPIDVFGVGTNLAVGRPDAALDGVYKLALSDNKPRIKFSETLSKTSLPYEKAVYRIIDANNIFLGDLVTFPAEKNVRTMHHPFEPLKSFQLKESTLEPQLNLVMQHGKRVVAPKTIQEIAQFQRARFQLLPDEYKRFDNPHIYKVGLSEQLKNSRDQLIKIIKEN